jgi:cytochrome P450
MSARSIFPLGAAVELSQLELDPHPLLARLRAQEPVSWLPALDGWLITRHDFALEVMRDPQTFTVQDPRFSTAQVVGPSMLSLDGEEHARHRAPFVAPFRIAAVRRRFARLAARDAHRLIDALEPAGTGELRRGFAGPVAASIVTRALGLDNTEVESVLSWYDAIVASVTSITAGEPPSAEGDKAFARLRERLEPVIADNSRSSLLASAAANAEAGLSHDEIASNAAVLLFGGIETSEGMIANSILSLLERPEELERVRARPELIEAAIDESLRLEPAAAVIDRYALRDAPLGEATVGRGDLVRISLSAANRDPAVFEEPDRFDLGRPNARRHLAFAQGPHVCVGIHLARLEAREALAVLLERLPGLRLDPDRPSAVRGLVFRKPPALHAVWS